MDVREYIITQSFNNFNFTQSPTRMIKIINSIVVFALEMGMLFTYGYYGMTRNWNLSTKLLFTVGTLALAIYLWAMYAAPKSSHQLEMPYLAMFRAAMFLVPAFLLFRMDLKAMSITVVVLALLTQLISYFTE